MDYGRVLFIGVVFVFGFCSSWFRSFFFGLCDKSFLDIIGGRGFWGCG